MTQIPSDINTEQAELGAGERYIRYGISPLAGFFVGIILSMLGSLPIVLFTCSNVPSASNLLIITECTGDRVRSILTILC